MNRLVRGSIMFVAAAGAWACKTNLGENADVTDHLVATPSVLLVSNTDSQSVDVEALNPDGQQLVGNFAASNVGAGIVVRQDTAFLPVAGGHSPVRARFVVRGTDPTTFVTSSFTVSANGKTVVIPVSITPAGLSFSFTNPTPALGEVVTITAPANVNFTPASAISFGAGITLANAVITGIAADSSTISFLLPPGITSQPAVVTKMALDYLPGQLFTLTTTGTLTTPVLSNIATTISNATPNVGDTLTLTFTAPFSLLPSGTVTFGGKPVTEISRTADSSSITFVPYPGAAGATAVTITGAVLDFLTAVPLNLPSSATMNLPTELAGAGSGSIGTAPVITIPATGLTSMIVDAGAFVGGVPVCDNSLGGPCRVYQFTIASTRTFTVTETWQGTTDMGVYFSTTGANIVGSGACDSKGATATGQPETCSQTFAAGTYYMVNDSFSPFYNPPDNADPTFVKIVLVGQ